MNPIQHFILVGGEDVGMSTEALCKCLEVHSVMIIRYPRRRKPQKQKEEMKKKHVYTTLSHGGRKYYECLKGNGNGGCGKHQEITKDVYEYLLKNGAVKMY